VSNHERTGLRELTMSRWHREGFPDDAVAIDVDLMGSCPNCCEPIYLWECVRGDRPKSTAYMRGLVHSLTVPVPLLLIRYWTKPGTDELDHLLASFRMGGDGSVMDAQQLQTYLQGLRVVHQVTCAGAPPWKRWSS